MSLRNTKYSRIYLQLRGSSAASVKLRILALLKIANLELIQICLKEQQPDTAGQLHLHITAAQKKSLNNS